MRRFLESGYSGFYFSVHQEGELQQGDTIYAVEREPHQVSVADLNQIQRGEEVEIQLLQRAVQIKALPAPWRNALQEGIE